MAPSESAITLGLAKGFSSGERYPDLTTMILKCFGFEAERREIDDVVIRAALGGEHHLDSVADFHDSFSFALL